MPMNRLQKSLALGFILVCFPLGVLAQNAPSTKGQYDPVPRKGVPTTKAGSGVVTKRTDCTFRCGEDCRVRYAPNTARWVLRSCENDCMKKCPRP
jgi:hypothetical protein